MQITVKSSKVLKKGTNDYGEWELVSIVTVEDVTYTTLAKEAKLITPGSIINIKDMDKDDKGRESFKKYEIISKSTAAQVRESSYSNGDSPEKRKSIEDQTRAERITELWIAGKIPDDDTLISKLRTWLDKLGTPVAERKTESPTAKPEKQVTQSGHFENAGQFMAAVQKDFDMNQEAVKARFGCQAREIADLDKAWQELVEGKTLSD